MKKRLKTIFIFIITIIFTLNIFLKSDKLTTTVLFSINIFIKNIFSFLFPMFIISNLLIELNIPYYLGKIFERPITFLFKSNKYSAFVFFISMLSGFPSSAKTIDDLINKKVLTKEESEKILIFTFFSNPLFIIGTIGISFFQNYQIGIYILLAHFFGNIITGIVFRNYKINTENKSIIKPTNNLNLFKTLTISTKSSIETLINIFSIFTLSLIVINTIFVNPNNLTKILITGIIEMTSGLKYLSLSNLSLNTKLYISVFFISFGSLSIHMQIYNILNKRKVKYLPFLTARIIHGLISIIVLYLIIQMDKLF